MCRGPVVLFYLMLLFIGLPLVELSLLLILADRFTWSATLVLVILTGIVGASLARWQGWRTVQRMRTELHTGQLPGEALMDAGMILVAAALLVTPGILTDLFGFSLLAPPCRRFYRRHLGRWLERRFHVQSYQVHGSATPNPHDVIDADAVEHRV